MKFRKAVFIVTYSKSNNGIEYLLLHRKLHWKGWEFPKGGIETRESLRKTVLRELKEETGLKALKIKKFKESGKYEYSKELADRKGLIGQTYSLFSAEVKPGKIKFDRKEHRGYKWVDFKKAMKILTWPNQKKCLKIVNSSLKK